MRSARKARSGALPVSAERPVGISMATRRASRNRPTWSRSAITRAASPRSVPEPPVPRIASTITPGRGPASPSGPAWRSAVSQAASSGTGTTWSASCIAVSKFALVAPVSRSGSVSRTAVARSPRAASARSATSPSPPLPPRPHRMRIRRPLVAASAATISATARPAFSIRTRAGTPASSMVWRSASRIC